MPRVDLQKYNKKVENPVAILWRLVCYFKHCRLLLTAAMLSILAYVAATIGAAYCMKPLTNLLEASGAAPNETYAKYISLILGLAGLYLLSALTNYLLNRLMLECSAIIMKQLRTELFDTMHWQLGEVNVIAEDLGLLTDSVRALVRASGCPNMKVLQFAIDPEDTTASNDYWPHNYNTHCVVYTGTHDNPTLAGWYAGLDEASRRQVRDYLGDAFTPDAQMYKVLIRLALRSVAKDCIIPIQDYLGLGNEARMNQPGTVGFNWRWRLAPGQVTDALADELMALTKRTGRVNWDILNG